MKNLKTFEDFLNTKKTIEETNNVYRKKSTKFSNIVSEDTQKRLWETLYNAIKEAVKHENDQDPNHTLEQYLNETAMVMGSAAAQAMHSDDYFSALKTVSNQVVGEGTDGVDYSSQRDELKEYLDTCIDLMKESFCKKLDEFKKTNHASATLVMKKIKEEKSKIYKQSNKINETH